MNVSIQTEAESSTEVEVEVRDEVELRVTELQISTCTYIETKLSTDIKPREGSYAIEGECLL